MKKIAVDVAYNAGSAMIGVASVPFYISHLGLAGYGFIGLIFAIQGFIAIIESMYSPIQIRGMLSVESQQDRVSAASDNKDRSLRYAVLSIPVTLIGVAYVFYISKEVDVAWYVYFFLLPIFIGRLLEITIRAILISYSKSSIFFRYKFYYSAGRHGLAIGLILLIPMGDLGRALELFFLVNAVVMSVYICMLNSKSPGRVLMNNIKWFEKIRPNRTTYAMLIIVISNYILTQGDKLILGSFLSLEYVGLLFLSITIASPLTIIAGPILSKIIPYLKDHKLKKESIKIHLLKSMAFMFAIGLLYCLSLLLTKEMFLDFMNLKGDGQTLRTIAIVIVGYVLNIMVWIPYNYLLLNNQETLLAKVQSSAVLLALSVWILLFIAGVERVVEVGWLVSNIFLLFITSKKAFKVFKRKAMLI